jgi:hypothetical protein
MILLLSKTLAMSSQKKVNKASNGEVVIGDLEYDGRVILYIIKGYLPCLKLFCNVQEYTNFQTQPTKHPTSTTSNL